MFMLALRYNVAFKPLNPKPLRENPTARTPALDLKPKRSVPIVLATIVVPFLGLTKFMF